MPRCGEGLEPVRRQGVVCVLMRPDDVWVECRWRERLLRRSMSVMRCSRTKSCRSGSRTPISAALSSACNVFDSSSSIAPRAASDGLLTGNGHCHFCDHVTWRVGRRRISQGHSFHITLQRNEDPDCTFLTVSEHHLPEVPNTNCWCTHVGSRGRCSKSDSDVS